MESLGRQPQIPNETRWMSDEACVDTFLDNYHKYKAICARHADDRDDKGKPTHVIEPEIITILENIHLYTEIKYLQSQLSVVSKALNTVS